MFGDHFVLADEFRRSLALIERDNPTAGRQGKGECCRSGVCCWRRPGAMSPADVARAAAALGMTAQELFGRYLVADQVGDAKVVLPGRRHQVEGGAAGSMIGWRETYSIASPCVFLGVGNACRVHDAKPASCANFGCWKDDNEAEWPPWTDEELRALGWDGLNPDEDGGWED